MSKAHGRRSNQSARRRPPSPSANDGGIYAGFVIVGFAVIGAGFLLSEGKHGGAVTVGYVAAIAWLTNLYGWLVWSGRPLAGWKLSLARIPLRFAGYGTKHGRPVEAAHDHEDARRVLIISGVASVVLIAALALLLIPGLLP